MEFEQIRAEVSDQCSPSPEHPVMAHRADSRGMFSRGQSADDHEGVTAFLEKRPAVFSDRVSDWLPDVFAGRAAPQFE
jgi:hypothetical protein